MAHPNEALVQELYARFGQGDLAGVLALCDPGIMFVVPGRSGVSGTFTYDTFGPVMIAEVMRRSGGTFREEIDALAVGDDRAAVFLTHRFVRDGTSRAYQTLHAWEIKDGRFTAWREYPADLYAFDDAWGV